MATPFASFTNLRFKFERSTEAISDLRYGVRTATEVVVIDAWGRSSTASPNEVDVGGLAIGTTFLTGYLARYAVLPTGADWLDLGVSWDWVSDGLRPPGLKAGERMQAFWGEISELPDASEAALGWFTLAQLGHPFGTGGIGVQLRSAAGDKFSGVFTETR